MSAFPTPGTPDSPDPGEPTLARSGTATRTAGRATRDQVLRAASAMFAREGLAGTSVAAVAADAGVFPSQITYYFGGKEALFVEAACRMALEAAAAVEEAAASATEPSRYVRALVGRALRNGGLPVFVEAMLLCRRRPELAPRVERTLNRLHAEGARAVESAASRNGWKLETSPEAAARAFWTVILGVALEAAALGENFHLPTAEASVLATLRLSVHSPGGAPR